MVFSIELFGLSILALWLCVITVVLIKTRNHYRHLVHHAPGKLQLEEILEEISNKLDVEKKETDVLHKQFKQFVIHSMNCIQKTGVVRYNPFSDTGGTQSFSVALLDGNNTGFIITSLYARTGNRWYIKEIVAGKGKEIELTKEEELAISKADTSAVQ